MACEQPEPPLPDPPCEPAVPAPESNQVAYARAELQRAGYFDKDSDYGGMIGPAVVEMVKQFADEGHSGMSAHICIALFRRVASFRPLSPLQNPMAAHEYHDVGEYSNRPEAEVFQSTRLSSVFSEDGGKTWYDIDKKLSWFRRKVLRQFRAYIQFPYLPK